MRKALLSRAGVASQRGSSIIMAEEGEAVGLAETEGREEVCGFDLFLEKPGARSLVEILSCSVLLVHIAGTWMLRGWRGMIM